MEKFIITPEMMQVIINIQGMRNRIFGASYNAQEDFQNLQHLHIDELRSIQEVLIPDYNNTVKNEK